MRILREWVIPLSFGFAAYAASWWLEAMTGVSRFVFVVIFICALYATAWAKTS